MLQDPPALQSVHCLLAAVDLCQQFLHPRDHLTKEDVFVISKVFNFIHKTYANCCDWLVLDGMRCIWTSVVCRPLVNGGSWGTVS